ncbi:MAG: 2OG-Fe(II) oxygenase [Actinobacteria bacterium]|nr:2OG-Fe(II) oxygenase [Actinomycetota bacterium]
MDPLVGRPMLPSVEPPPYQTFEIHPKAFTAKQCDRIVAQGLASALVDAALEGDDGAEIADDDIRRSRTSWLAPDDDTWWIYDKLAKLAERANRRYGFELTGFGEDLQFTAYDEPGSFYSWHQDGLDGGVSNRKLSIVVQLSDPEEYTGGELQFFETIEDYDDEQLIEYRHAASQRGTAIVFPSFEYHRVLPMRTGQRYSLVSWVTGPAFR